MKKGKVKLTDKETLRKKAESQLKKLQSGRKLSLSEKDLLKLNHELEVHQIELEMQNDELVKAKEEVEVIEEKYIELYDYAPSGYVSLTKEGMISELNFAAAKMLGKERSKLMNQRFIYFISESTREKFNNFTEKLFMSKIKQTCEVIMENEGESSKCINIEGFISPNNELCLLTLIDITERKRYEAEIVTAKEHAEESDHLKSAFLANMSHEIRTPMNGILGFAELLKEPNLTGEEQQKYIGIIEKSGIRMLNIINDIIDISKIEAGLMKMNIQESEINKQTEYIYTFFKHEVEEKGMKLSYKNGLPDNESIIYTDREKVYAILTNLIKNAIKYTHSGSIEFGYKKASEFLEFFVKDTGIGIPKDRQSAIFERFVQADIADKMAYQGAGLGLSISKSYIEMLGGKIWVESDECVGSEFYFTLPYRTVRETNMNQKEITDEKADKRADTEIKGLNVLIAEDDETSWMLFEMYMKTYCKEIIRVRTGIAAVEECQRNPDIDLVLMDIRMPQMSGYEATKQIRQFNKDVIIIAQTAYGLTGDRERAIAAGCNDYISKPIRKSGLEGILLKFFNS